MRITDVEICNFRGLRQVKIKKTNDINVIVGPNAIGKSTVLEAIRLCKTLLSNRFSDEGRQVLTSLSAVSAHAQVLGGPGVDLSAIANDPSKVVDLTVLLNLDQEEIEALRQMETPFAMMLIQNSLASSLNDPLAFTQYLSSPDGQKRLAERVLVARAQIANVSPDTVLTLKLLMDPNQKTIRGADEFSNSVVAILDRRLPIQKTLFSLFSADRQLPRASRIFKSDLATRKIK